ncbi:MAG TPA: hypothetical protein PK095_06300, partial [Myxococcota bacterium]|nr:hypothetical protein [Myxococcota bacterium]
GQFESADSQMRALVTRAMALRAPRDPATDPRSARETSRRSHATTDVEVLPPGSLPRSPLRKRPVVIDVD